MKNQKIRFTTDNAFEQELKDYSDLILCKYGVSSRSAEREIKCMVDEGSTVAEKLYADLIFNKKILRKHAYREAFELYLKSAGITVSDGKWTCDGHSYPLSFWIIGYYLVNYKRESFLSNCETIDTIEAMSLEERLAIALELAIATIEHVTAPGAINLIGRLLSEIAADATLFTKLQPTIDRLISDYSFSDLGIETDIIVNAEQARALAEQFFVKAAEEGYVYACNNLAMREAERIISLVGDGKNAHKASANSSETTDLNSDTKARLNSDLTDEQYSQLSDYVMNYICFLKLAADRYEPYAANRLGLFYRTGEIRSTSGCCYFKEYQDFALAKEYFQKATVYPDENSGWAFLNLMKYYYQDYESNIDLMNEHMDYIKQLSPKAYDIAIEL